MSTKKPLKRRGMNYYVVEIIHPGGDKTHAVYKTEPQAKNVVQTVRQGGATATLWHGSAAGWDEHAKMVRQLLNGTWKPNFTAKKVTLAQTQNTEPKENDGPKTSTSTNDSSDRDLQPAAGGDGGGFDFGLGETSTEEKEPETPEQRFETLRAIAAKRRAEEADEIRARSGGGDGGRLKPSGGGGGT